MGQVTNNDRQEIKMKISKNKYLAFALFTGSLLASPAFAGTSATVTLGGTVSSALQITKTETSAAGTLDLSAGLKIVKVADLNDNMNLGRISSPTPKDHARIEKYRAALIMIAAL